MTAVDDVDPHEELGSLVAGVRALLEQLEASGADDLPQGGSGARRDPEPQPARRPQEPVRRPQEPEPRQHEQAPRHHEPERAPRPVATVQAPEPPRVRAAVPPVGAASVVDRAAARVRLAQIEQVVAGCTRCPLHAARTKTVFARGNPDAELMFVGEGPGAEEDAQGLPFVGKAGQLLDKMIQAMGYQPDDVYVANVVKCRPPDNRKPEPNETAACVGYLHEQIALVRPKAIVALGATAVEGLLGISGITRLRGTWRLYRGSVPVMPTFHPAYLLRTPAAKREVWEDLKQVMAKLGKAPPGR